MFSEFSTAEMMGLLAGAVAAHIVFLFISRRINPLFILTGIIIGLAAFSGAQELEAGSLIKWIRGYALVFLVVIGVFKFRARSLGPASLVWLVFAAMYVLAGVWSATPPEALMYKGQFGLIVLGGTFLAYSIRDRRELIRGIRFLCVVGGVLGLVLIVHFLADPSASIEAGRARFFGVRANNIAYNLVALLLLCTYLALNERSRLWKAVTYACCGALIMVVILSGSRGAMATLVLAILVQLLPWGGRWLRRFMLPIFMALTAYMMIGLAGENVGVERFVSTEDTRAGKWSQGWSLVKQSPLIGHGYVLGTRTRTGGVTGFNAHSAYMQVLVDAGTLGLIVFATSLLVTFYRGVQMHRFLRRQRTVSHLAILPLSLVTAIVIGGLVASVPVYPSSLALLLTFCIGLIDRLPGLVILEKRRAVRMMRPIWTRRRFPGVGGLGSPEAAK